MSGPDAAGCDIDMSGPDAAGCDIDMSGPGAAGASVGTPVPPTQEGASRDGEALESGAKELEGRRPVRSSSAGSSSSSSSSSS